ncbi:MAG: nucleotidyltransferase family protein [Muribaculaceae bacterium]
MQIDAEHNALLTLVRSGLWEMAVEPLPLQLSDESWARVFEIARNQTVTGIAYRGLQQLPDEMLPPMQVMMRWMTEVDRTERTSNAIDAANTQLSQIFTSQGITPITVKGQGVARLYEHPELRQPGDIDLFFTTNKEFVKAAKIVESQIALIDKKPDGSMSYNFGGFVVEHHRCIVDLCRPRSARFVAQYAAENGYINQPITLEPATSITIPSPTTNLLVLNAHIMKHAIGSGIGLRQLCDMARACHIYSRSADITKMAEVYSAAGIDRWSRLLHSFLVQYLGLPVDEQPYTTPLPDAAPLLRIIVEGGNFGHHRKSTQNPGTQSELRRKIKTAGNFARAAKFSCKYAPIEAIFTVSSLFIGQFR